VKDVLLRLSPLPLQLRSSNETVKRYLLCYSTQLTDPKLLSLAVGYYRLVARWLVAAAAPPEAGLPLPATVPRLFAALPEACMDDVAQVNPIYLSVYLSLYLFYIYIRMHASIIYIYTHICLYVYIDMHV